MTDVVKNLVVNKEKMRENLHKTKGLYNSQRVLLKLVEKGLTRESAYRIVQKAAMISWEKGEEFIELLKDEEKVKNHISEEELKEIFDLKFHTRNIDRIYKKVLK